MIALGDLKEMDEAKVKEHLAKEYGGGGYDTLDGNVQKRLESINVLVAYESVGWWGCDSSSWFLLRDKKTKKLYEVNGSHCSCCGFENQFKPQETTIEALRYRATEGELFWNGGYDNYAAENSMKAKEYVLKMKK